MVPPRVDTPATPRGARGSGAAAVSVLGRRGSSRSRPPASRLRSPSSRKVRSPAGQIRVCPASRAVSLARLPPWRRGPRPRAARSNHSASAPADRGVLRRPGRSWRSRVQPAVELVEPHRGHRPVGPVMETIAGRRRRPRRRVRPSSDGQQRGETDQLGGLGDRHRRPSTAGGGGASSAATGTALDDDPAKPNQSATAARTGGVASRATSRATTDASERRGHGEPRSRTGRDQGGGRSRPGGGKVASRRGRRPPSPAEGRALPTHGRAG